ncbi:MAG: DNA mismatch repair endonuclease MutL [Rhodothermales bacterium]
MSEELEQSAGIIQTMPLSLANKIAAGEVVQRPASAAKELIENAIDAGATEIKLVLKAAGSELIQVIDDGCGMCEEDALACFDRHATSKIKSIDDLESIRTLGFRGEALASIAAVSQVELKTRRMNDEMGFSVRFDGGTLIEQEPCAAPPGTSIAIRNLFYNVPARRSFLKSPATEFKHLVETFQFLALSHPIISFTLLHDNNEVYHLPATQTEDFYEALKARIIALFGKQLEGHLLLVEEKTSYISVAGFVSSPEFFRKSRGEQFLFVNERYVKNRYLEHAVRSAYEELLPENAFPFFTLFLSIDPRHVDVNVHPTKAEVKFDDERGLYGFMRTIVRKGLGSAILSPQLSMEDAMMPPQISMESSTTTTSWTPGDSSGTMATPPAQRAAGGGGSSWARPGGGGTFSGMSPGDVSERMYENTMFENTEPAPQEAMLIPSGSTSSTEERPRDSDKETLLWQLHGKYILTQIRSGVMIIDQNAAHERVLYEKAIHSMESGFGLSQQLLFPHTIEFNPGEYALIQELMPNMHALGFEIEMFGGTSVIVRGVPNEIRVGDERTILEEILEQFKTNLDGLKLKGRENLAKSMARRGAVQSGTQLDIKEMRSLVDQLFLCDTPYACPYGRPTIVNIAIEELDKRFGKSEPRS